MMIQSLVTHITSKLMPIPMGEKMDVDEQVVPLKGRYILKRTCQQTKEIGLQDICLGSLWWCLWNLHRESCTTPWASRCGVKWQCCPLRAPAYTQARELQALLQQLLYKCPCCAHTGSAGSILHWYCLWQQTRCELDVRCWAEVSRILFFWTEDGHGWRTHLARCEVVR